MPVTRCLVFLRDGRKNAELVEAFAEHRVPSPGHHSVPTNLPAQGETRPSLYD